MNLNNLKVGDEVLMCNVNACKETHVIRVTKTRVVVKNETRCSNYQTFRKSDGRDFGPTTSNVYFLREV